MFWALLVHIGLPLVFGIAFVFYRNSSSPHSPTWDIAVDTALDLAILGIGATGAIFENSTVEKTFGEHLAAVQLSVVGASFLFSSLIVTIKRYIFQPSPHKFFLSIVSIDLGCLALITTSAVLWYAYYPSGWAVLNVIVMTGIALGSATFAGTTLSLVVRSILTHTPAPERIASDPKTIEVVAASIRNLDAGEAIKLEDLSFVVQSKRKAKTG